MKKYSYSGKNQTGVLIWQWAGCMAFLGISPVFVVTFISIFLVPFSPYPSTSWTSVRLSLLCWTAIIFFGGFSMGSFFINYFPTIWIDNDAIYISYFFLFRLKIPWTRLIDISMVRSHPKIMLIRAHKITPWHIHYSAYYSFSFKPGFLIKESIDDFDELLLVMKGNIQNNLNKTTN